MDQISLLTLSISSVVFAFLIKHYHYVSQLPPGPRGLPFVGNILDLKKVSESNEPMWITYLKWSHLYGDVFTFHVFGSRTIVLNSYKAIMDLLEHQSQNYSDRPRYPMLNELLRWGWNVGFMQYSEYWRLHRRVFHEYFQPRVLPQYYDIQRERTSLLIQDLTTSPKDFFEHVTTHSGGIMLEVIYGYQTRGSYDSYVKLVDKAIAGLNEAGVGKYLVDYFPILKYIPAWFPGAGFRTKAELWAQDIDRMVNLPWNMIKTPRYEAGGETTVSYLLSFILTMVLHPKIQARAQKELDGVTGFARLPDFSDRDNLPYIDAILAEVLRWNPVAPFSIPHQSKKDDMYEGYLIPSGSTIIPNVWAALHDESIYGPDTLSFNPDRFIKQDGEKLPPNPDILAFGFGRRQCPGRQFAINTLWLAMTYLLASFTIAKEIDPVVNYTAGLSSHPRPFNCRFIPRPSAPVFN
ncbi:cytochrome P450 [Marasmius fiardii PR-910]|nr:cytochrome P450 [Marasmius fiardii PR-910]